jgi:hypothetical protein
MLLSKQKIQSIQKIFTVPYRPSISTYQSEEFSMQNFEEQINKYLNNENNPNSSSKINPHSTIFLIYFFIKFIY